MSPDVLPVNRFENGGPRPTVVAPRGRDEPHSLLRVTAGADRPGHRRPAPGALAGPVPAAELDPAGVCADLSRCVVSDDLSEALNVVAAVAGCATVLLRPDRSVLATGELRTPSSTMAGPDVASRSWRWTAGGPHVDRELAICAGTHLLGVLVFHRPVPVPGLTAPVWQIVHDLLALALIGRDATQRAAAAELRAALLACLADDDRERHEAVPGGPVRYRPTIVSPVPGPGERVGDLYPQLTSRMAAEPLLTAADASRIDDRIVVLYPDPGVAGPRAHAEAWHRIVAGIAPLRCRVVVGTADTRGAGLRDAYRTSRWLADLQSAPVPGLPIADISVVDELGVVAGALGPGWGPRVGHFVRRVLGDLVGNPRFGGEMIDTLYAYLVCGGSPTEASRLLHLSPSSMKYRMRIIRETLGDGLDDHDSTFEIELALRLLKAVQAGGGEAT